MHRPDHDEGYRTGQCLLTDELEVHLVGAYHHDDLSQGAIVESNPVEQVGFAFNEGKPVSLVSWPERPAAFTHHTAHLTGYTTPRTRTGYSTPARRDGSWIGYRDGPSDVSGDGADASGTGTPSCRPSISYWPRGMRIRWAGVHSASAEFTVLSTQ